MGADIAYVSGSGTGYTRSRVWDRTPTLVELASDINYHETYVSSSASARGRQNSSEAYHDFSGSIKHVTCIIDPQVEIADGDDVYPHGFAQKTGKVKKTDAGTETVNITFYGEVRWDPSSDILDDKWFTGRAKIGSGTSAFELLWRTTEDGDLDWDLYFGYTIVASGVETATTSGSDKFAWVSFTIGVSMSQNDELPFITSTGGSSTWFGSGETDREGKSKSIIYFGT